MAPRVSCAAAGTTRAASRNRTAKGLTNITFPPWKDNAIKKHEPDGKSDPTGPNKFEPSEF
jgi:hypothetical protein